MQKSGGNMACDSIFRVWGEEYPWESTIQHLQKGKMLMSHWHEGLCCSAWRCWAIWVGLCSCISWDLLTGNGDWFLAGGNFNNLSWYNSKGSGNLLPFLLPPKALAPESQSMAAAAKPELPQSDFVINLHRGNFLPWPMPGTAPGPFAFLRKMGKGMVPFCSRCQIIRASCLWLKRGKSEGGIKKKGKKNHLLYAVMIQELENYQDVRSTKMH